MVTLVDAFWLFAFFHTLVFDPGDIGADSVGGFLVIQIILTAFWIPLFRAVRGRSRPGVRGGPRRGDWRAFLRVVAPGPTGTHTLATSPDRPRTTITPRDIKDAKRFPGGKRKAKVDIALPNDGLLAVAEQAFGNALYQLDLRRDRHELTRAQISALRVTGFDASAWLSADGTSARLRRDGIRLLRDLAEQTERLLIGRAGLADVDRARSRLALFTEQARAGSVASSS